MDYEHLIGSLSQNLEGFELPVSITEGYDFDQKNNIKKIELYRASRFESGEWDSQGNRKYFFNIINPQCGNSTKNIDIDRRDIRVRALRAKDRIKAMLYTDELKYWMRKEKFGVLLNKLSENLPIYGSEVFKKVGKTIVRRPLRYLKFDPAISNSPNNFDIQSPYLIDEHSFTAKELEDMVENGWDKEAVADVAERMRLAKQHDITIYEYYAEIPKSEAGLEGEGWTMSVSYIAASDTLVKKKMTKGTAFNFMKVLYVAPVKSIPYKKVDYLTIEGRAQGLGIGEMLFPLQERRNEMGNQKAAAMRIASKTILQTRDKKVEGNILDELDNGDIIKVDSEITQIATEERNLGAYAQEENNIIKDTRDNANAQEILTGESLPSRTPFRLGVLQQQNAAKLFDFIRENIGMFLEEVIVEWVLPEFEKDVNKEHIFGVYSRDTLKAIMKEHNNYRINEAIKKYVIGNGKFPSEEELLILEESLNSQIGDSKFVKVVKDYFKDFDKDLDIDITGEKHDSAQQVETLNNLLMLIAQNPAVIQDPTLAPILDQILELTGIAPNVLNTNKGAAVAPTAAAQATGVGTANAGSTPIAQ